MQWRGRYAFLKGAGVGMFSKWPLMLHSEPRLWGVLVLDDPRNPAEWRGRRVEFSRLRAPDGSSPGWLPMDADGRRATHNGHPLYLRFRTPDEAWLSFRSGARAVKRSLSNGSLELIVSSTPSRAARRLPGPALALVGIAWLVGLWLVMQHHRSLPPSTVVPIDLPAKLLALSLLTAIAALYVWVWATILRRSCERYRLTSEAIVPLDGTLAGRRIERSDILKHRRVSRASTEVHLKDRKAYFETPLLSLSAWMGTEREDRKREYQRAMRTLAIAGVVVAATATTGALLLPPEEAQPPQMNRWVGLGLLLSLLGACACLFGYVLPRMQAWDKQRARRHRQKERAIC